MVSVAVVRSRVEIGEFFGVMVVPEIVGVEVPRGTPIECLIAAVGPTIQAYLGPDVGTPAVTAD